MGNKVQLDIVTPEQIVYSEHVDMVVAKAANGDVGVMARHFPFVSPIIGDTVRVKNDGSEESFKIRGGFIEVRPDKITILAESADV